MKYLMSERRNGARLAELDTEVDEEYVERYAGKATREFFENLGGKEERRVSSGGVIYCKSTSPDGETVREVVFTPVPLVERQEASR